MIAGVLALVVLLGAAPPPDVTGQPVPVAIAALQQWQPGLTVRVTPPLPSGADAALAVVTRVDIRKAPGGEVAELAVASRVPPLVGLDRGAAGTLVRRHGLVPVFAPLETIRQWTVRSVDPPEGTLVRPGSRVSIVVGPPVSVSPSAPTVTAGPPLIVAQPPAPFPVATVLTAGGAGLLLMLLLLAGLLLRRGRGSAAAADVTLRAHPGRTTGPTLTELGGPSLSVRLVPHRAAPTYHIEDMTS